MGFLDKFKRGLDALKGKVEKWTRPIADARAAARDEAEGKVSRDLFAGIERGDIFRAMRGMPPASWHTKARTKGVRRTYRKALGIMGEDQRKACVAKWGRP